MSKFSKPGLAPPIKWITSESSHGPQSGFILNILAANHKMFRRNQDEALCVYHWQHEHVLEIHNDLLVETLENKFAHYYHIFLNDGPQAIASKSTLSSCSSERE